MNKIAGWLIFAFAVALGQPSVRAQCTLRAGEVRVDAGRGGRIRIARGRESYLVESAYSYPGEKIGWNRLSEARTGSEARWRPRTKRVSAGSLEVEARGRFFSLRRTVVLENGKMEFEDRLANLTDAPVGLLVRNSLTASESFISAVSPGGAENPTIFLAGAGGSLGLVMEDDVSRLRFKPVLSVPGRQAEFQVTGFTLDVGKSYTLRWTIYLLGAGASYFHFINRVRQDWRTDFPIQGPFAFFDLSSPLLSDPMRLKSYLKRKSLRIVALSPWLDYDPGSFDRVWPREEYKERVQRAIRTLKEADPGIQCLGSIETDWVTIYPERIKGGEKLPVAGPGAHGVLTAEQTAVIDNANLPWKDSVKRNANGNLTLELYISGGKPQTSLSVYPAVGNHQYDFMLGQVKFLLDEVGVDGVYIDEFSQGWDGIPHRDYTAWDGWSAEIDPKTGRIGRKYIDCSLRGVAARVNLCNYALKRGKIVVANTYSTSSEEQPLPVNRFAETLSYFNPFAVTDGVEPPEVPRLFSGALASPIGLGILAPAAKTDTARRINKALITYLRHGMLYYHYDWASGEIAESGPGSGEYGSINHMFPMTIVRLEEGWIEGRERTITCVSGSYLRPQGSRPTVHLFDLDGREKPHGFVVSPVAGGWQVQIALRDWCEIAVIEN